MYHKICGPFITILLIVETCGVLETTLTGREWLPVALPSCLSVLCASALCPGSSTSHWSWLRLCKHPAWFFAPAIGLSVHPVMCWGCWDSLSEPSCHPTEWKEDQVSCSTVFGTESRLEWLQWKAEWAPEVTCRLNADLQMGYTACRDQSFTGVGNQWSRAAAMRKVLFMCCVHTARPELYLKCVTCFWHRAFLKGYSKCVMSACSQ